MREINIGFPPAQPPQPRRSRWRFTMKPANSFLPNRIMKENGPPPGFRRQVAASITFQLAYSKARRAVSVWFIPTNKALGNGLSFIAFWRLWNQEGALLYFS